MKRIALLGSTGSIGLSALEVIDRAPGRFQVVGLAAGGNYRLLAEQASKYQPRLASICAADGTNQCAARSAGAEMVSGAEGLCRVATMPEADLVLIAVAGAASLAPTLAAVEAGKTVALASKEALVMAGPLILAAAKKSGARILPVDSEHAGVFQALAGRKPEEVRRIVLPASGGPFLHADPASLAYVTPEQALAHPTWSMGRKISIDSATLMNKALEIIEAHWLFGLEPDRIEVVIHPQSVVHALVEMIDGSVLAQLAVTDMRLPILHALAWPERIDLELPRLDLAQIGSLAFLPLDPQRFPAPGLAGRALARGGTAPAVLAAADEALVAAFLDRKLPFTRIVPLAAEVLAAHEPRPVDSLAAALEADAWARAEVAKRI
jgi:1-deoxy-D-xylulose-5-phosphate reductoisomerase